MVLERQKIEEIGSGGTTKVYKLKDAEKHITRGMVLKNFQDLAEGELISDHNGFNGKPKDLLYNNFQRLKQVYGRFVCPMRIVENKNTRDRYFYAAALHR